MVDCCCFVVGVIQFLMCRRGEDIILVTLNHIDTVRSLVGDSQQHIAMLDSATKTLVDVSHRLGVEFMWVGRLGSMYMVHVYIGKYSVLNLCRQLGIIHCGLNCIISCQFK